MPQGDFGVDDLQLVRPEASLAGRFL
jgi:hypothetical protein